MMIDYSPILHSASRNASLWVTLANGTIAKTLGDAIPVTFAASAPMHVAGATVASKDGKLLTALCKPSPPKLVLG